MLNIGKKLRELRTNANLTQSQIAQQFGLTTSAIASYESGARYPSYDILKKYSRKFHRTTDYLLGMTKTDTVDISDLSDIQKNTILQLIQTFEYDNNKN